MRELIEVADCSTCLPEQPLTIQGMDGFETHKINDKTLGVRPKWINVEERLPSQNQKVLCFGASGIFIGDYDFCHKYWRSDKCEHCEYIKDYDPVTHWMPLPHAPKENE